MKTHIKRHYKQNSQERSLHRTTLAYWMKYHRLCFVSDIAEDIYNLEKEIRSLYASIITKQKNIAYCADELSRCRQRSEQAWKELLDLISINNSSKNVDEINKEC